MTGPELAADCSRCRALCCVAPAFVASADFAITKAAGRPCPNLRGDDRCGIHESLPERGFPGCVAYDCFGAGQQVVQVAFGGGPRTARMLAVYDTARQLHELLFYAADALSRPAAGPVHGDLTAARVAIEAIVADADALLAADPAAHRRTIAPLLRRASTLIRTPPTHRTPAPRDAAGRDLAGQNVAGRHPAARDPGRSAAGREPAGRDAAGRNLAGLDFAGRDLAGRGLVGVDLRGADLSTAVLLGADLRRADLRSADFLGADLRGADLRGADLTDALYLTRSQVGATRLDGTTRLPRALDPDRRRP